MSVIYYSSNDNETALRLQEIIEAATQEENIEIYQSMEGLSKRLRQPDLENNIAVVLISAMAEIFQICSIKRLSNDIRVILILPDRSPEVISAGYKLHPRFISYADSDFKEVAIVLRRMLKLVGQRTILTDRACIGLH
jgi:type III secretion system FlhB-like substrate exporter